MDLDRIDIQISANATNATKSIKELNSALVGLNTSLSALTIGKLGTFSASVNNFAKAVTNLKNASSGNNFKSLASSLTDLNNVNSGNISGISTAINQIATSMRGFGNTNNSTIAFASMVTAIESFGSANMTRAINNMPQLTTALSNMISVLSKAGTVNSNVISLINSIANLASQGQKVGTTAVTINRHLSTSSKNIKILKGQMLSVSSAIGKLYAELWVAIRAFKYFGSAVKESMDYGETMNYFNSAFRAIGEKVKSTWEDNGAESAEAYVKSFTERAGEVTSQLSNIRMTDNGIALSEKALGLSGNDVAKYQAQYAQMASSMGVSSENAMHLSEVLVKLGGDLASIRDMDFNTVWKDMTSGMAGMSRTLDKYGANIRVSALDQKLLDLGINATSKDLSQQDKVLLRVITMLDSTEFAWSDLSDTINSNANQLRLVKSNWKDLSIIMGNMVAPALKTVLPYINAIIKALQSLAIWVGNLFGLNIAGDSKEVGSDLSGISEGLDDIENSASNATGSAKKLKQQLLGIDEINNITTDKNSGSGGGGGIASGLLDDAFIKATERYLAIWQDGFDNVKNKIEEIQKAIENSEAFKLIKDIFSDIKNGDWSALGTDITSLFKVSADSITELIDSLPWEEIGANVGKFLETLDLASITDSIFRIFESIVSGATKLWLASLEEDWLDTILITAIGIATFSGSGKAILEGIIAGVTTALVGFEFGKKLSEAIFGADDGDYEAKLSDLKIIFTDVEVSGKALQKFREEHPIIFSFLTGALSVVALPIMIDLFTMDFKDTYEWCEENIWEPIDKFFKDKISPAIHWFEDFLEGTADIVNPVEFIDGLAGIEEWLREDSPEVVKKAFKKIGKLIEDFIKEKISPLTKKAEAFWTGLVDIFNPQELIDGLSEVEAWVRDKLLPGITANFDKIWAFWQNIWYNIGRFLGTKVGELLVEVGKLKDQAVAKFDELRSGAEGEVEDLKKNLKTKFDELKSGALTSFDNLRIEAGKKITEIKNSFNFTSVLTSIKNTFKSSSVTDSLSGLKTGFSTAWDTIKLIFNLGIQVITNLLKLAFGPSAKFDFSGLTQALSNPFTTAIGFVDSLISKINQVNGMSINVSTVDIGAGIGATVLEAVKEIEKKAEQEEKKQTPNSNKTIAGAMAGAMAGIPKRANGGYVDYKGLQGASLFYAGEHGIPEMIGQVSGRSAVVGGNEITGISDTIRSTSSQEVQLLRQQNELLAKLLAKPMGISNDDIFNSVRNSANNYTKSTGLLAF